MGDPEKRRQLHLLKSPSEDELEFQDEDKDEFQPSEASVDDPVDDARPSPGSSLLIGDFAVVRVERKQKESFRLYVTKVIEVEDDGYVGVFFKKKSSANKFEETEEEGFFHQEDIVYNLSKPIIHTHGRFKDMISFEDDLNEITLY